MPALKGLPLCWHLGTKLAPSNTGLFQFVGASSHVAYAFEAKQLWLRHCVLARGKCGYSLLEPHLLCLHEVPFA